MQPFIGDNVSMHLSYTDFSSLMFKVLWTISHVSCITDNYNVPSGTKWTVFSRRRKLTAFQSWALLCMHKDQFNIWLTFISTTMEKIFSSLEYSMWPWIPRMILLQACLFTYSLLRGVTFTVCPLSSHALSTMMLPLLETFLELLLWNSFQCCHHIFLDVFSILKSSSL